MKTKTLKGVKIDSEAEGTVTAVFSTLNVIDKDGDVTRPGAFEKNAPVRISAYNHASWGPGSLPVGKGTINEVGDEAILNGKFFMDTTMGRDTFTVVKELGDLGEWSYGYDVLESAQGQQDGRDVNFLDKLKVHEVSPVILGAGENTRTLAAKIAKMGDQLEELVAPKDVKLSDHLHRLTEELKAANTRVAEVMGTRAEQGKQPLTEEAMGAFAELASVYEKLQDHFAASEKAKQEFLVSQSLVTRARMLSIPDPQE